MSFVNKVVIVTGASAGIGAATIEMFAKEGAAVVLVGRDEARLAKVAEVWVTYAKSPLVVKADITKDDEAKTIIEKTIQMFGKIDILVNNAGYLSVDDILKPTYMAVFDATMNVNMRAIALLTNLAAPYLVETKGNIVNISSISTDYVKLSNFSSIKTSKAALNHFTRCIALELAPHGVRVNTVSPGPVYTEVFEKAGLHDIIPGLKAGTALNRIGEPEEIADVILFLASDNAKSVTGSDYVSDNGMRLK